MVGSISPEHRNMPLDDALSLVARSFEKFLQAEKEKLASLNEKQSKESSTNHTSKSSVASTPFLPPPKEVSYLLNLLADSRHLTLSELDTVVRYLTDRRDRLSMEEDGLNSGNTHGQCECAPLCSHYHPLFPLIVLCMD